jgi:hypothetical protein
MGGRFWGGMVAAVIGIGIAACIVFLIIGAAFTTWGILGGLIFFAALLLGFGWIYDRRKQAQYEQYE